MPDTEEVRALLHGVLTALNSPRPLFIDTGDRELLEQLCSATLMLVEEREASGPDHKCPLPLLAHPEWVCPLQMDHFCRRGSDVEKWLKKWRDQFYAISVEYAVLDAMLDDYRLRADVLGATLLEPEAILIHGEG